MPTAPTEIYAARPVRLGAHSYVVATARTPWMRHVMDRGPAGDLARWLTSGDRPEFLRRRLFGEDVVVPGPWPFGLKFVAGPHIHVIEVDPVSRLAGLALTAWALATILRHPRRHHG